jgi:predicted porin
MQKKLIALALASAFAAPAFAATSNVDVGGYLNFSVDYLDSDNAANGGNTGVSSNASNIYFKGSEDLGGGLKALWQIQTFFTAGGTGASSDTSNGVAADSFSSGNTFVGLAGGFGTVILGKNESPVKMLGRKIDFFGNQIGDNRNLTSGFDTRPNNQIAYTTPSMSGFTGAVSYWSNSDTGAAVDNSVDGWAAAGTYDNGPLMLGLGYEKHNTGNAVGVTSDEKAWRLSVGYTIADLKLVALYQDANDLGGVNGADRKLWGVGAGYNMGNILLKAQYYKADDVDNVNNSGADMFALGVDYSLSKRTKLQFAYAATDNDANANFSAFGGGHGDKPAVSNGGNPDGFSVGVVHTF